ncbi:tetratricopeptide repeat protein [Flavobacterium rhizosphaerae]|uniref:Tetratricopeptide repeat protein n=1 Tax=Flavobacterium rhizosphaerae TaxID=3163298 RepID=A0ABW8YRP1_9FLAO
MKQTFILIALLLLCYTGKAQNLTEFNQLLKDGDSIAQKQFLEKWEKTGTDNPDFYVACFNYYVNKSRKENITFQNDEGEGESFVILDSLNNKAGYLNSRVIYNEKDAKKALQYIDKGIDKFPERLDMRFGEVYFLGKLEEYEKFTGSIIKTIDYSATIKNAWLWKGNQPLDDAKAFMLGSVQDYVVQLYNTGQDALFDNIRRIAEAVLKHYPDHVESLSNLSIAYMMQNKTDKALEALLKAEKLAPEDTIVLGNIAHAYKLKKDKANAVKYYNLVKKYGDEDEKAFAEEKIKNLGEE